VKSFSELVKIMSRLKMRMKMMERKRKRKKVVATLRKERRLKRRECFHAN